MKYFHYQAGIYLEKGKGSEVTQHVSELSDFIHGLGVDGAGKYGKLVKGKWVEFMIW
jgi:hypothetical protein